MDSKSNGVGFGTLIFLLFLGLKLGGAIDWSWWWVFAPLWVPVGAGLLLVFLAVLLIGVGKLLKKL